MKLLTDLLPVLVFFAVYKLGDIYAATAAAMAVAVAQAGWLWLRRGRLEPMQAAVVGLIVVLGALTLIFNDPAFIKWKPTLVNWAFAAVLIGGELIGSKGMLERMLSAQLSLPKPVWRRLTISWIGFFIGMGALNLFVAYSYDLDTWVDFKLYGVLGLTLLFALLQGLYFSRHLPAEAPTDKEN
jgi:intracellular septation protein